jgi:hypothetical protein
MYACVREKKCMPKKKDTDHSSIISSNLCWYLFPRTFKRKLEMIKGNYYVYTQLLKKDEIK